MSAFGHKPPSISEKTEDEMWLDLPWSRATKLWLRKTFFKVLEWTSQSLDLQPIESVGEIGSRSCPVTASKYHSEERRSAWNIGPKYKLQRIYNVGPKFISQGYIEKY